ncbi:magnesium transporter [Ekhidna sp.]|uniref:magnesium transporter n=1 Tax=Ekhidna sp. TaxID=2608089 RepID=UPI003296F8BD
MQEERPWESLRDQIKNNEADEVKLFLESQESSDLIGAVGHLTEDERAKMLTLLTPEDAAELIEDIPWVQALRSIKDIEPESAAAILSEMTSDDQADFLLEMKGEDAEAILEEMDDSDVKNLRNLIRYDPETAGGLMVTEFLAFEESETVESLVDNLRQNALQYKKYHLQYIYMVSGGKFGGVLSMRDLLLSNPKTSLNEIAITNALVVNDQASLEDLIKFFDVHNYYGVPVVDDDQALIGVVLREDIREAQSEQMNTEHLETQGIIGGEELRTMPILLRARRRLSWLSVNILLNIAAASIIAIYQDTLSAVIALAVFLPIISDMSGCSGNQAVAVSLRELSLGVVRPFEMARVWLQEVSVGLINGAVLGLLIGVAAYLWQGNAYLGLVVGGALMINTVVAVSLGGTIPLFLKKMNVDPALASGPILTTVTDMFGFFLALTFAGMMLSNL